MADKKKDEQEKIQVSWKGYLALFFAIIFFSGIFAKSGTWPKDIMNWQWLGLFDFNVLTGKFGVMKDPIKATFQGQGGMGAQAGFLFALSLFPTVMFALGVIEVIEHFGGLRAAQKLMNPLLRPLMGIPGITGLALISSMQSTDAGSSMTKSLFDEGLINERERTIFAAFQFTAGGTITNYLATGSALFAMLTVPIIIPLVVLIFFKVFGANMARLYLKYFVKGLD